MNEESQRAVQWWRYKPIARGLEVSVVAGLCRAAVWPSDAYRPHQCSRRATQEVAGYGACKQHATILLRNLNRIEDTHERS